VGFCEPDMSTDLGALDTVLMLMMSDGLPVLVG
jgi:hypothetical protein